MSLALNLMHPCYQFVLSDIPHLQISWVYPLWSSIHNISRSCRVPIPVSSSANVVLRPWWLLRQCLSFDLAFDLISYSTHLLVASRIHWFFCPWIVVRSQSPVFLVLLSYLGSRNS